MLFKTEDIAYNRAGHVAPNISQSESKSFSDNTIKDKPTFTVSQDKQSKKETLPPQILYKVHYIKDDKAVDTNNKNKVNEKIQDIKGKLKEIKSSEEEKSKKQEKQAKKKDKETLSIYHKSLELLSGLRYLVKDANYSYEHEYRLLCFASEEHIPNTLKSEDIAELNEKSEEQGKERSPRIYVETNILEKLCGVLTAPKASTAQLLYIRYLLKLYRKKDKLSKLECEDDPVHTSSISYR